MNTRHPFFFSMFACITPVLGVTGLTLHINHAFPLPFHCNLTNSVNLLGSAPARKLYTKHVNYATSCNECSLRSSPQFFFLFFFLFF